ncbi:MAG: EamA family transporter [Clostridia bacterium]|nr:EamA family transporter [Clostridia bacterium]
MTARIKLFSSMFLFGTIGLFVRAIPLPSSMIALVRAMIGTAFLLLVLLLRHEKPDLSAIRRNIKTLAISGTAMGFNWILLFEAYRYTTVAVATLCYYFSAIFVIIASPFVLKEKLTPVKAVCSAVALAGMVLVSGVLDGAAGTFSPVGVALGLGAAVLYATVVLLNKRLESISSFDRTISQLGVAAVVLLPYVLLTENLAGISIDPFGLLMLLTVAVLHTGAAYAMYFSSLQSLKAQTVALFSYLDPVVALLLSVFVLREPMSPAAVIGAVLVLGAMLASELLPLNQKKADTQKG